MQAYDPKSVLGTTFTELLQFTIAQTFLLLVAVFPRLAIDAYGDRIMLQLTCNDFTSRVINLAVRLNIVLQQENIMMPII